MIAIKPRLVYTIVGLDALNPDWNLQACIEVDNTIGIRHFKSGKFRSLKPTEIGWMAYLPCLRWFVFALGFSATLKARGSLLQTVFVRTSIPLTQGNQISSSLCVRCAAWCQREPSCLGFQIYPDIEYPCVLRRSLDVFDTAGTILTYKTKGTNVPGWYLLALCSVHIWSHFYVT